MLSNVGSAPAEDIDLAIHVPDGPEVETDFDDFVGEEPSPPDRPRTAMEIMVQGAQLAVIQSPAHLLSAHDFVPREISNVSDLTIRKSSSYDLGLHVQRIKQHEGETLSFALVFESLESAKSLTLAYRINTASLPAPVTGDLHLIVRVA
jgi:uncharacterized membrane protein